jgi:hypothetical protein
MARVKRISFRPPSKGPVHRTILRMMSAERGIHFRTMRFMPR